MPDAHDPATAVTTPPAAAVPREVQVVADRLAALWPVPGVRPAAPAPAPAEPVVASMGLAGSAALTGPLAPRPLPAAEAMPDPDGDAAAILAPGRSLAPWWGSMILGNEPNPSSGGLGASGPGMGGVARAVPAADHIAALPSVPPSISSAADLALPESAVTEDQAGFAASASADALVEDPPGVRGGLPGSMAGWGLATSSLREDAATTPGGLFGVEGASDASSPGPWATPARDPDGAAGVDLALTNDLLRQILDAIRTQRGAGGFAADGGSPSVYAER